MKFLTVAALLVAAVAAQTNPTPNGQCGGPNNFGCTTPGFGGCCSSHGFCGDSLSHCGSGCAPEFSAVGEDGNTVCLSGVVPSTDGRCGAEVGATCAGGEFEGACCSAFGYCGTGVTYCSTVGGCQAEFGAPCTTP